MKRMQAVLLGLALSLYSHLALGAAPAAPPAELFFKEPDLLEAQLSPAGTQLAVTTARAGHRIGLYVYDLRPGGKATRAALFTDVDVVNVQWVNEERLVFSAVDYSAGGARPDGAPGLFSVMPDGKQMRMLVKRQQPFFVDGTQLDRALHWNHVLLRVPMAKPGVPNEEVLVGELMANGNESPFVAPLWLNVRTSSTRYPKWNAPAGVVDWQFDSAGEARLAITRKSDRESLHWRGPGDKGWRVLSEHPFMKAPFDAEQVDDAGMLYVSRPSGTGGTRELVRFDFDTGVPAAKPVVSTPGFDYAGHLILERGSGRAMGVRLTTDAETTVWFDEGMKALQAEADAKLPGGVNRLSCRRCGEPDQVTLVRAFSDRDPGMLWIHRRAPLEGQRAWQPVAQVREGLKPAQMATQAFERIAARDGRDLPVWITMPATMEPGKPLPAVVLVHGGPWVRGSNWGWHAMPQFLASRGFLVIEPEFRGSDGYGRAHLEAGFKQWGLAMQDDVADALLWARKKGLANDKACIAGSSYGGYSTYMGLIRHPELYRCGVAWVGVADLMLYVKGSWWIGDDISKLGRNYQLPDMVGDVSKDAALLAAASPLLNAERLKAPLLIAHGELDQRVPLAHSERLRDALRKHGNEPQWVVYSGEGHGFYLTKNRVDFAERMERFLAQHLKN
jgi:dipeptidyl aminopeptidase/acylaminoacyl peptidase